MVVVPVELGVAATGVRAVVVCAAPLQPRLMSLGHFVNVGGVVSLTRMIWVQMARSEERRVGKEWRLMVLLQLDVPLLALSPTKLTVAAPHLSLTVTKAVLGCCTSEKQH